MMVLIPLTAIGLYLANPFGVKSYDPRERVLGYGIYRMPASSMMPTIRPGQIVISSGGYYNLHAPRRGDVVVFAPPREPGSNWVKRIVGLPGETIEIRGGKAVINGVPLVEPYVSPLEEIEFSYGRDVPAMVIATDHYYLLGDNRDNSDDSRYWGTVSRSALKGKLLMD
ncbi:MAG TPA: signal peptidase I [Lysobacter sp.]|nr:signal peptidase I [Lysobacter sp.]